MPFPFAMFVFGVPVSQEDVPVFGREVAFTNRTSKLRVQWPSAPLSDAGSDPGRSSETSLRYEEAKLYSRGFVDEQHGRMIGRVTFLDDVRWDDFPLAIFQVLPLV